MSTLALLLALASAVRPTGLAAVYGILGADRPRRLLLIFDVAGLIVTMSVGILLVLVLKEVVSPTQNDHYGAQLILAAACFAGAVAVRRRPERVGERRSSEATRRIQSRLRDPSVATVAAAGVLTHFPGLFYLIALNAISASDPTIPDGFFQVTLYNVIWFAIPLLALALAIFRPERTAEMVQRITDWARRHQRTAVPLLLGAIGIYLTAKGLSGLL